MQSRAWRFSNEGSSAAFASGGVNAETAGASLAAGANMLVAGSYLFRQQDMKAAVESMKRTA